MNDDETLETRQRITSRKRETKEGGKATTGLGRPVEAANVPEPMGARVDGDSLPDEPFMGSNKRPRQLSDMLPDPNPAWSAEEDGRPQCAPEIMR